MSEFALKTSSLTKVYGDKYAIQNLSLSINEGGVHAIVGSNGAGKSTLFKMLLGFITPDAGNAHVLGVPSARIPQSLRERIAYVNDEHTLPDWLSVKQVKQFQQSYFPKWDDKAFKDVIGNFAVDSRQKVSSLSRGERAGLSLAMALAQQPDLLILDEPTLGLDVVSKQEFIEAVLFCTQQQVTTIYCSHQMEEVERLADQLIILERGELRAQCSPDDFRDRISQWIVDAKHKGTIEAKVPEFLCGRIIDDHFHFYALDCSQAFKCRLALLGIAETNAVGVGLSQAVRAFLQKNHAGQGRV
jgi:ABC-2 type transport system ATP-binding protein